MGDNPSNTLTIAYMADENIVTGNTPNPTDDAPETVDQSLNDQAKLEALEEANKKLFARAKTAEGFTQNSEGRWVKKPSQITKQPTPVDDDVIKDVQELKLSEKKRQFGFRNSLSPEETDKLFKYAGQEDPTETLKDPFFQSALSAMREKTKTEQAIPSSSNRSTKVGGKSFKEMDTEERKANWNKVVGSR